MPGHVPKNGGRPRQMSTTRMRRNRRVASSSAARQVHGGSGYLISTGSGTNITHYRCPSPNAGITSQCVDVTNEVQVNQTLTGRTELPHSRNRNSRVMGGGMRRRPNRTPNPNGRRRRTRNNGGY